MPKEDGVYWCSLGICMTSDNKYSLDQNKQAALAEGQLPHKQMGNE